MISENNKKPKERKERKESSNKLSKQTIILKGRDNRPYRTFYMLIGFVVVVSLIPLYSIVESQDYQLFFGYIPLFFILALSIFAHLKLTTMVIKIYEDKLSFRKNAHQTYYWRKNQIQSIIIENNHKLVRDENNRYHVKGFITVVVESKLYPPQSIELKRFKPKKRNLEKFEQDILGLFQTRFPEQVKIKANPLHNCSRCTKKIRIFNNNKDN